MLSIKSKIFIVFCLLLSGCATNDQSVIFNQSSKNTSSAIPLARGEESCVLIDTDFDIDDMMAIPLVISNMNVAAIITTEGYTYGPEGASALSRLIAEPSINGSTPIIIGANFHGRRDVSEWPWLAPMRAAMQRANRLLTADLIPRPQELSYEIAVKNKLQGCNKVSVLIIGAFTSFVKYSPLIRDKIDLVVMQGRPRFVDDPSIKPKISFNCGFDLAACEAAFDQLKTLNAKKVWVDVPRSPGQLYSPTRQMVEGLDKRGLPGALRQALLGNQITWNLEVMPKGEKSLMWDQLAALYMLHPDLYVNVPGGFMEPSRSANEMRALWTEDTNRIIPK